MNNNDYQYRERNIELDIDNRFQFGEGKISAFSSLFLGILSLLAVLAYLFPSYLTTIELREGYDAVFLQKILKYGMYFSLFFGVLTIILNKHKLMGGIGIVLTLIAFALGGIQSPSVQSNRTDFHWV